MSNHFDEFVSLMAQYVSYSLGKEIDVPYKFGNDSALPGPIDTINAKELRKRRSGIEPNMQLVVLSYGPWWANVETPPYIWKALSDVVVRMPAFHKASLVDTYPCTYDEDVPVAAFANDVIILRELFNGGLDVNDMEGPQNGAAVSPDVFEGRAREYILSLASQYVQAMEREMASDRVIGDQFTT